MFAENRMSLLKLLNDNQRNVIYSLFIFRTDLKSSLVSESFDKKPDKKKHELLVSMKKIVLNMLNKRLTAFNPSIRIVRQPSEL